MQVSELHQMLFDSTAEVLETMFFTTLAGDAEPDVSSAPGVSARLFFRGKPSGSFGVRVPLETARKISVSFLGMEEEVLTNTQIGEVVCELANMVCGSVLSRLESKTGFDLFHPELEPSEASYPQDDSFASRTFELDEGMLQVWARMDPAQ